MKYTVEEILEVHRMLSEEDLDIRSVTLSINTHGIISDNVEKVIERIRELEPLAKRFSEVVDSVGEKYGIRIVTKRIAISPLQFLLEVLPSSHALEVAKELDELAIRSKIDYISGYSAFVDRGISRGGNAVLSTLSAVLNSTSRLSGMINAGSTMGGVNIDAIKIFVDQLFEMRPEASARVAIMSNVPPDSPFVPSAHHGLGMPDAMINIAVSGPGVIEGVIRRNKPKTLQELHDLIKRTAFKITRLGELIGRAVSKELGVQFGIVDLSLAPSPKVGDSVAGIIEAMGISKMGGHGSLMALAILIDAVKKGGAMATSSVGGLSGAFIPVSEDYVMSQRALDGSIDFFTLLSLSAVCNTGIDMVGVSKKQGKDKVIGLISDVLALGVVLNKTLGVRVIPVDEEPGKVIDLGGLLGRVVVMKLKDIDVSAFTSLSGYMPSGIKRLEFG